MNTFIVHENKFCSLYRMDVLALIFSFLHSAFLINSPYLLPTYNRGFTLFNKQQALIQIQILLERREPQKHCTTCEVHFRSETTLGHEASSRNDLKIMNILIGIIHMINASDKICSRSEISLKKKLWL